MNKKLFISAISKFLLGFVLVFLLLFIPAGSFNYWNGWLLMCILFIPMFVAGIVMMIHNPKLLKSRLDAREKEKEQKTVILSSALMFIIGFVIAGLDYRFEWFKVSYSIVLGFSIMFLLGYFLYLEVLRENEYLSRTIGVQEGQKVIDTGLYGIVRHPMYLSTLILFLSMPIVLGSVFSFLVFLAYPFIINKRIKNEEMVLEKELNGYKEYKKKVKYKMIPFIW